MSRRSWSLKPISGIGVTRGPPAGPHRRRACRASGWRVDRARLRAGRGGPPSRILRGRD